MPLFGDGWLGWVLAALGVLLLCVAAPRLVQRRAGGTDSDARAERKLRVLVIALITLFAGTVLTALVLSLRGSQRELVAGTQNTAENLARVVEEQTAGSFDSVDIALKLIARTGQIQASDTAKRREVVDDLLTGSVANLPFVRAIWVLDADGDMVHDSEHLPGEYNLADRTYFQVHRDRRDAGLYIDRPLLSKHGVWTIPVSRRIDNPDGSFGGVIAAALRPDYLEAYYTSLDVGRDGFVSLLSSDGVVMQNSDRLPASMRGRPLRPAPLFVGKLRTADAGTYRNTHPFDGIDRVLSYRRVGERPLVILVGLGVREHLAAWQATARTWAIGSVVLLGLVVVLGYRLLGELRRRQAQRLRIERLSRIQVVLSGVNALTVRAESEAELFEGACRIAVEQGGFDVAWIDHAGDGDDALEPVASAGDNAGYVLQDQAAFELDDDPGLAALAVRRHATATSVDLRRRAPGCPRRARLLELGYHSCIALPLFREGGLVAALSLATHKPDFFDEQEVRLLDELASDLSYALDHISARERARYLALYDTLTGLPNRTLFIDRTGRCLAHARDSGGLCAIVKLDIERFRQINDSIGWSAGDALLRTVAARLQAALGEDALLARTERDHFAFTLSHAHTPAEIGLAVRQALHACFDELIPVDGHELHIAARAGIAVAPVDGDDTGILMRNADAALFKAKDSAERLMFYAPTMNARVAESLATENRLRGALERGQFVLHYQPKFDARSGALVGLEGLIRWNDPDRGLTMPAGFISILEETGLILDVGQWVMHQAVRDFRRWRGLGLDPPRIAVNVSALQLRQDTFTLAVRDVLEDEVGTDPGLELEITESMLMEGVESSAEKLDSVRGLGVHIAIDDFGTGYSSLQYIARLPLDTLKIDRSFVTGMTGNDTDREIVASVISLAHQLRLKVVAEGVDSEEQARLLRELDCDEMQGYLFSPPVPPEQIERLMRQGARDASARLH